VELLEIYFKIDKYMN